MNESLPVDEIGEAVVEHGRLTKEQILETWGLSEEDYARLQARFERDRRFEEGLRGTGRVRPADASAARSGRRAGRGTA